MPRIFGSSVNRYLRTSPANACPSVIPEGGDYGLKVTNVPGKRTAIAGSFGLNAGPFMVKDVEYLPQMKLTVALRAVARQLKTKFNADIAARTLFLKREAFSHESEVRIVVYPNRLATARRLGRGIRVPVDPHELIRGVLVDPRTPEAYVEAYKHYLRAKLGYRGNVLKSLLYSGPEPIEA